MNDKLFKKWEFKLVILLFFMILAFSILTKTFNNLWNYITITQQMSEFAILAIGMTIVIMTGGIDLSIGSIVGLTTVIIASSYEITSNIYLAIIFGIITSVSCGFFNGFLIAKFNAPAMLITLGTQILYRGIALVLSKGNAISNFPEGYFYIGQEFIFEYIPIQVIILFLVSIFMIILLNKTEFGKNIFNIGNNILATQYSGINTEKVLIKVYTIAGILAGITAIIISSRVSTARADLGTVYVLQAVAAVVLGGTSISGGSGSIEGTILGVIIFAILGNGLNHLDVNPFLQTFIMGICLIIVLVFNNFGILRFKYMQYLNLKNQKKIQEKNIYKKQEIIE